ncbi:phosphatidylinositol-specific phospholipase C [Parabacteroides sp. OttesenSCG-928-O15]|nr:phosphatidylinositol-specific phospholipase C [Parabacteroides sp. OttesenSCG-928-O15]
MKQFRLLLLLMGAVSLLTVGCDSDTPLDEENPPAIVGGSSNDVTRSVTSGKKPKKGEDERSSDNFKTSNMASGTHFLWNCPDTVNFDVKRDYRWPENNGKDTYFARNLGNGSITKKKGTDYFYIANPKGAGGDFEVVYTVFTAEEGYEYASSRHKPHADQTHRSSFNFSLTGDYTHYEIECPEGITFSIHKDKTAAADEVMLTNMRNGMIITNPENNHLYIADPHGATYPFVVTFKPAKAPATDWMAHVDGKKYLYELSIPGTHDSGTGTDKIGAGSTKCQNFSFATQLNDGIRFIDVRMDDNLQVCHGFDYAGLYFTKVLEMCNSFLDKHPKETILMSIKGENGGTLTKSLEAYFAKDSVNPVSKFYRKEDIPTLNDARGKIVMFRRFKKPETGEWGININDHWPQDSTGVFTNGNNSFYVEDKFFEFWSWDDHDTKEKVSEVKQAIKDAYGNSAYKKHMFLTFNSVAIGLWGVSHTPWTYAWGGVGIDPSMNPALSDILDGYLKKRTGPVRFGTVILDFYNKHGKDDNEFLVYKIINANFKEDLIPIP